MRQAELKTVCDSHKAHILCSGTAKGMDLKTDGTTRDYSYYVPGIGNYVP